ncbi:ChaN family lipoprotein [Rudanella paleaurantiibacter]
MKKPFFYTLFSIGCAFLTAMTAPDRPAYQLYSQQGKAISYSKLLKQAAEADVVLFGELHNNPICHWLELQLTKDLYALKKEQLVLGGEMFETDNQTALADYAQGRTTDKEFAKQARLWPNYPTDYRPLVDFARANKIPFVATNAPRRYASLVAHQGLAALDTVTAANKQLLAPLPLTVDLTLPGYKAMLDMMGGSAHSTQATGNNPHGSTAPSDAAANFARAQAIKDATMAHFINQSWQQGKTVLHYNGDYHSKNFEGISWYLRQQRPNLRIFTISSVELSPIDKLPADKAGLANAILVIPADMTKTY